MKKILLIHPEGNINNNPNLTGIVEILCENGYAVEIVSPLRRDLFQKQPCEGSSLRLIDFSDFGHALYYGFLLPQDLNATSASLVSYINNTFGKVDFIFGVDRGIIEASVVSQALKVPYGLISYEIYSVEETNKEFKEPEILACRGISFAVCQDRVRSSLLSRENHIPLDIIIDIPVAGRGFRPTSRKTYKIHDSLSLSHDTKIALYMGSITYAWSMIGDLLKTIPDWPSDWVLLLHHRYGPQASEELFQQFPFLRNSDKVFLSPFQHLDFNELPQILQDVDLGLAFYLPQHDDFTAGNNLKYIGMASGKIATYLQHGLPIMVNEIGLWSDVVRDFEIGCVIKSAHEIPNVLKNLTSAVLGEYRSNIRRFYETSFDLNLTVQPLLRHINDLLKEKKSRPSTQQKDQKIPPPENRVPHCRAANLMSLQLTSI